MVTSIPSRSVRRRTVRRRTAASAKAVQVALTSSADGITQSFLIMPGKTQTVVLRGYAEHLGGFRIISVPVTISAHLS